MEATVAGYHTRPCGGGPTHFNQRDQPIKGSWLYSYVRIKEKQVVNGSAAGSAGIATPGEAEVAPWLNECDLRITARHSLGSAIN
ncbi:MAG: hypothetical protein AUG13_04220 [Chloroflexi bacterium 13_1_20CM_2_59_7]|nr:MAG: hypothetical protein AUG13_04220 [Chloroflexi bacterium 13_1_20CM_2_59_7]